MKKEYKQIQEMYSSLLKLNGKCREQKREEYSKYILQVRKEAYKGNGEAQFDLALHYEELNFFGENKFYNPQKVFYWTRKSCENEVAAACNNLGTYYEEGVGCDKSISKAIESYKQAIHLGDENAYENLMMIKSNKSN